MKSCKLQDEIKGEGNARTIGKSSKISRMVNDYDVDDFEIANSGGDEALPPPPTQSMNSVSVKIPRPGRDSRNNSSEKLKVTEGFHVNNVDKNDVTLLASTRNENVPTNSVTEKNMTNEISKAIISQPAEEISAIEAEEQRLSKLSIQELREELKKALYDESIVKQAHYLVQTLRETGLQKFRYYC